MWPIFLDIFGQCVRCGRQVATSEAVAVSLWDGTGWVDWLAHADREVCREFA
jgi:hypothetical protein